MGLCNMFKLRIATERCRWNKVWSSKEGKLVSERVLQIGSANDDKISRYPSPREIRAMQQEVAVVVTILGAIMAVDPSPQIIREGTVVATVLAPATTTDSLAEEMIIVQVVPHLQEGPVVMTVTEAVEIEVPIATLGLEGVGRDHRLGSQGCIEIEVQEVETWTTRPTYPFLGDHLGAHLTFR